MNFTLKRRGLTIADVMATVAALSVLLALVLPALARGKNDSHIATSLNNLRQTNTMFEQYAAEFNGRQPSAVADDFSTFGATGSQAMSGYASQNGHAHPPVLLGHCYDNNGNGYAQWGYYMPPQGFFPGNYITAVPFDLSTQNRFGFFRMPNVKLIHKYLGVNFYAEIFYAPNDRIVYPTIEPWFDHRCEFAKDASGNVGGVGGNGEPLWSSYCFSPAAMVNPLVLQAPSAGGYTNPYSIPTGFQSPTVTQAKHPGLKTRYIEHHWNQNTPPDPCTPAFMALSPYGSCWPWFFNSGAASAPASLFFDGSTRLLPNTEVIAADAQLIKQTGEGLWHRQTPWGTDGYYSQISLDGTVVNHHILTIDGIRGRDTLGPNP